MVKEPRTQAGSKVVEQVLDDFEAGIDVQVDVDEAVVTRVDVCIYVVFAVAAGKLAGGRVEVRGRTSRPAEGFL